jgi:hypothetical protein
VPLRPRLAHGTVVPALPGPQPRCRDRRQPSRMANPPAPRPRRADVPRNHSLPARSAIRAASATAQPTPPSSLSGVR